MQPGLDSAAGGIVGLDIGGANLKAANTAWLSLSRPFAVWKHPERLAQELRDLLGRFSAPRKLAVTMTAELCDCFPSKQAGVNAILDAVESAADGAAVVVWQTNGRFVGVAEARREYLQTAAANWLALATFAGRFLLEGPGLVIDVGSTTTDIVPMRDGVPVPRGRTDLERLMHGELVYTGVKRTPICALVDRVELESSYVRPAAEWFATTLDAYLWLGELAEDPDDRDTADGRPATREYTWARLARMFCADPEMLPERVLTNLAAAVRDAQIALVRSSLVRVFDALGDRPGRVLACGAGEFLVSRALAAMDPRIVVDRLSERVGAARSIAAGAFAVAVLASEME